MCDLQQIFFDYQFKPFILKFSHFPGQKAALKVFIAIIILSENYLYFREIIKNRGKVEKKIISG